MFALASAAVIHAQNDSIVIDTPRTMQRAVVPGSVEIFEDERITELMEKLNESDIPLEGFRIQLSFGKKEEVHKIRTEFLQEYPGHGAYISWLQPNFRLRVGDFRTRLEAERFKHHILEQFPNCYIVADAIEPPETE